MSTTLTGTNTTDPTTTPAATCPADGDTANAASVNTPFQTILNGIGWLRAKAALWTGGTFTGAVNVPTPTADANAATKLYVDQATPATTKVIASAYVQSDGTIVTQQGSVTLSVSKLGTGTYTVTAAGMGASPIGVVTPGNAAVIVQAMAYTGNVLKVTIWSTTPAVTDSPFFVAILKL